MAHRCRSARPRGDTMVASEPRNIPSDEESGDEDAPGDIGSAGGKIGTLTRGWRLDESGARTASPPDGFTWSWRLESGLESPEPAEPPTAGIPPALDMP